MIFVVASDFGNQECSMNTHARIPGLHNLAGFQNVDPIHEYFKHTPLYDRHAIHGLFCFFVHWALSVTSVPMRDHMTLNVFSTS